MYGINSNTNNGIIIYDKVLSPFSVFILPKLFAYINIIPAEIVGISNSIINENLLNIFIYKWFLNITIIYLKAVIL